MGAGKSADIGEIPQDQWAIVANEMGKLQLKRIPVPEPKSGQVLVKVEAAAINPSDCYNMKGLYSQTRVFEISYPIVMGWAGSGTVVSSGGGFMANRVVGKRVSCGMSMEGRKMINGGTYQQYMVCDAIQAMPLEEDMSFEEGANVLVNPFTAVGLVDRVQELKAQAFIQTGAASQCGRMILKLAQKNNLPLINIVRREEQVTLLKEKYGAEHVLNSSEDGFLEKLKELAKELKATALIECVAGNLTGQLIDQLPSRSTVIFYGALSEKPIGEMDPLLMIGRSITMEAFFLGSHMEKIGLTGILSVKRRAEALVRDKDFEMNVHKTFSLSQFETEVADYYSNMSSGKYVLRPQMLDESLTDGADFNEFSIVDLKTE